MYKIYKNGNKGFKNHIKIFTDWVITNEENHHQEAITSTATFQPFNNRCQQITKLEKFTSHDYDKFSIYNFYEISEE